MGGWAGGTGGGGRWGKACHACRQTQKCSKPGNAASLPARLPVCHSACRLGGEGKAEVGHDMNKKVFHKVKVYGAWEGEPKIEVGRHTGCVVRGNA